jgi:hypothetical protein
MFRTVILYCLFLMLHDSTQTKIRNHNVLGFFLEETFPREGCSICISKSGNAGFGISGTLKMNDIF